MLREGHSLRKRPIIIGIHGLNNKPSPEVLRDSWKAAMAEGLLRNCGGRKLSVRFDLVYWADLIYPAPLAPSELVEPYVADEGSGPLSRAGLSARRVAAARIQGGVGKLVEKVSGAPLAGNAIIDALKARMPDLYHYRDSQELRDAVQDRLKKRLRSARRWRRQIMLVAHSMGSIIAYEALRDAGRDLPGLEVAHFVTMGSPLGLSQMKGIVEGPLRVPECVARWSNFADRRDGAARWDTFLSEEYGANSRGVTVSDYLVVNSYVSLAGKPNPHKVYGYLRTPEISELIAGFSS